MSSKVKWSRRKQDAVKEALRKAREEEDGAAEPQDEEEK
jgi:hypothetical protein